MFSVICMSAGDVPSNMQGSNNFQSIRIYDFFNFTTLFSEAKNLTIKNTGYSLRSNCRYGCTFYS